MCPWPKGKPRSEETRRKIGEANRGKCHSAETCKKISEAKRGERHPNWGKHHSAETRAKMSEVKRGKSYSLETRRKVSEAKKGEKNPRWKGGRGSNGNGYILVLRPGHPRAYKSGYVYEHILVAEEKLGRALLPGEVVHHINGIKEDNRRDNIHVFPSMEQHMAYHKQLSAYKQERVS